MIAICYICLQVYAYIIMCCVFVQLYAYVKHPLHIRMCDICTLTMLSLLWQLKGEKWKLPFFNLTEDFLTEVFTEMILE